MTFGIVFNPKYTIPNAAVCRPLFSLIMRLDESILIIPLGHIQIDFGVDAWAQVYGSAGSSSEVAWQYCYGAKMGYEVFARLDAP